MQTSDADTQGIRNDSEWQLLAECPISDFLSEQNNGNQQKAGLLFQKMQDIGVPLEYLENISLTLAKFANEVQEGFDVRSLRLPGQIRIFYQKKIMEEANSASVTLRSVHAEKPVGSARMISEAGTVMSSGWGYFILERAADNADITEKSEPIVDIYFYKEGN